MKSKNHILATVCALSLPLFTIGSQAQEPNRQQPNPPVQTESTVVRVYNVQDLIVPVHDFPLSTSTYGRSFVAPAGQPVTAQVNIASPPTSPFFPQPRSDTPGRGGAPGSPAADSAEATVLEPLIKLIEDNISPETWKDLGGSIGAIHLFSGSLVITQTVENHKRIVDLLSQLAREQGGMVRVTADWLVVSPGDVPKLTKNGQGDEALAQVDPTAIKNFPAGGRHFSGQTLSRNGQTVYLISGLNRSVVTSATPVVSTGVAAYSTDVANVGGGIALEINSRVNWEQKTALVTLSSTFSDPAQVTHENVAVGAVSQPVSVKKEDQGLTLTANQVTLMPTPGAFQPFGRLVQDMRSTVRVPLGVPIIAASMTLKPDTNSEDEKVLVLIIKVTASK